MADPISFRNAYTTAASVKAVQLSGDAYTSTWSADVLDSGGAKLGAPVIAAFAGPFVSGGVNAFGPRLLDLDVVASSWVLGAGGSWTSTATSQRA